MRAGDTIIAIGSAPGSSARAVVRLSGPDVREVCRRMLGAELNGRGGRRGVVALGGGLEAACLWSAFPAPRSYTGEDGLELVIAGAPALAERVVETALRCAGVRRASPGEFTARAFLNGRITLEQAEGVAMSIAASSRRQLDAAGRLLAGATGHAHRAVADSIAQTLALLEAGIDFTDQEDVVAIAPAGLLTHLRAALADVERFMSGSAREALAGAPAVALVGPPNAGKSTLFNALLGRRRAVVSDEAGTTRDVVRERLDLSPFIPGGGEVELLDLAGLDESADGTIERAAQNAAMDAITTADVAVMCDPSGRFDAVPGVPESAGVIRVRTKADLPGAPQGAEKVAVCALDGWNLEALKRAVADSALASREGERMTVLPRHASALRRAAEALRSAINRAAPDADQPQLRQSELVASDVRDALDAMGEISGRVHPDDIIGRVFTSFCVGK